MIAPHRRVHRAALTAAFLAASASALAAQRADVPYVASPHPKHHLDLSLPRAAAAPAPVVLLVHGGSLTSGDRRDAPWPRDVCPAFADAGYVCAAASYRLFPDVVWPEPARDIAAAFAWLHENVAALGGDPERIALVGHSSGCLLSTLVASDARHLAGHGLGPESVFAVVAIGCRLAQSLPDTTGVPRERLARAFASGGPYERFGDYETLRSYYPMEQVGAHLPPLLAVIAEGERFKPPILDDAATYVGLARDCEVDADLIILQDRDHMTAVERLTSAADPTFAVIDGFLRRLAVEGPRRHLADTSRCPGGVG